MLDRLNRLFLICLSLIAVTFCMWLTNADRYITSLFYVPGQRWPGPGVTEDIWCLIYRVTPIPSILLGITALLVVMLGIRYISLRHYRKPAVFMLLLLALGPGLLVNVLFKENLGRPRPREVTDFNGSHAYHQFWEHGPTTTNSSFPSGHASMAFATMGPWFLIRRRVDKKLEYGVLATAITWGGLVGYARIYQGAHFLSDIVWAGAFVYIIGELLAILIKPELPLKPVRSTPGPYPGVPLSDQKPA